MISWWNWVKLKNFDNIFFNSALQKTRYSSTSETGEKFFLFHHFFIFMYSNSLMQREIKFKKYVLELIKRRSKVNE